MNYEEDVKIDETALDIEWLNQASLFMKYARNAARSRLELDREKEKLDVIKAGLDKDIRTNPSNYGIEKLTEAVVSNAIIQSDQYHKANESYLLMKYEMEIAQAAVSAMNQRKDALENLVRLFGQQYFAGPKMPRNLSFEVEQKEQQKRADVGVARTIQRKK